MGETRRTVRRRGRYGCVDGEEGEEVVGCVGWEEEEVDMFDLVVGGRLGGRLEEWRRAVAASLEGEVVEEVSVMRGIVSAEDCCM